MEHSHILLSFFVVITMVFVASANDGGYKILSYGEDYTAYPWQRVNHQEWVQRIQKRENHTWPKMDDDFRPDYYNNVMDHINGTYRNPDKRTSDFEEKMPSLCNFGIGAGVKVIFGRVPVPVIIVPFNDQPKH